MAIKGYFFTIRSLFSKIRSFYIKMTGYYPPVVFSIMFINGLVVLLIFAPAFYFAGYSLNESGLGFGGDVSNWEIPIMRGFLFYAGQEDLGVEKDGDENEH